jgi:small subunit ribosomal protein S20
MAHTQSTRKRIRQDKKRHLRNQSVKTRIKGLTKKFRTAAGESDAGETTQSLRDAIRALDKAASKGIIPRRTASRKIGRLSKAAHTSLSAASQDAPSS